MMMMMMIMVMRIQSNDDNSNDDYGDAILPSLAFFVFLRVHFVGQRWRGGMENQHIAQTPLMMMAMMTMIVVRMMMMMVVMVMKIMMMLMMMTSSKMTKSLISKENQGWPNNRGALQGISIVLARKY